MISSRKKKVVSVGKEVLSHTNEYRITTLVKAHDVTIASGMVKGRIVKVEEIESKESNYNTEAIGFNIEIDDEEE